MAIMNVGKRGGLTHVLKKSNRKVYVLNLTVGLHSDDAQNGWDCFEWKKFMKKCHFQSGKGKIAG